MISLSRLISPSPFPISGSIKFYQTPVGDILTMGESQYWSLLKIWDINRNELIQEENEHTKKLSDFELWKTCVFNTPMLKQSLINSVDCFLHTKVEFLPNGNTIIIGEKDSTIILDEPSFLLIKDMAHSVSELGIDKKEEQYKENKDMSERERQMIEKMRKREEMLNKIKNGEDESGINDRLAKQIIGLAAIGKYTFEEVYKMTLIQVIYLLRKSVEIQNYELYTALSPYMDSKKDEPIKHWLNT